MAKVFGAKKLFAFKRYLRRQPQCASAIYWGSSVRSGRKVMSSFCWQLNYTGPQKRGSGEEDGNGI